MLFPPLSFQSSFLSLSLSFSLSSFLISFVATSPEKVRLFSTMSNLPYQSFPSPFRNPGDDAQTVIDRLPIPSDLFGSSYEVPNSKAKGYSPVYRSLISKDSLIANVHPDLDTAYSIFQHSLKQAPNKSYLAHKPLDDKTKSYNPYTFLTFSQVDDLSRQVGSATLHLLANAGVSVSKETIFTIYLPNCIYFPILDLASQAYSVTTTCLYDTLKKEEISHILKLTASPVVFTEKNKVKNVLALKIPTLKFVVVTKDLDNFADRDLLAAAELANIQLLDLSSLTEIGKANLKPISPPTSDNLFTLSFTSGTTSLPKGVQITHRNTVSLIATLCAGTEYAKVPNGESTSFEFLPLAHCYQRLMFYLDTLRRYVNYFPHDPSNVASYFEDIKIIKPSYLCAVPAVLGRIELALKAQIFASKELTDAVNYKISKLKQRKEASHPKFDSEIVPKLRAAFGFENVNYLGTGSAATSLDTLFFLKACFNVTILQGYGLTETTACFCCSSPLLDTYGTNGVVGPAGELRLRDIPEMNYTFDSNRSGEILVRGLNITTGYYKRPDLFKEVIDDDGWFPTGDVATLDDKNRVIIVDRVKNFFKLSQGKFIAAESVQSTYLTKNPALEQLFIYGDSTRSFLIAITGVNPAAFKNLLQKHNISLDFDFAKLIEAVSTNNLNDTSVTQFRELANQRHIRELVLKEFNKNVSDSGLVSFELMKNIHIDIAPFSVEKGTLTPTLKIKRPIAKQKFAKKIDELYAEGTIYQTSKL